MSIYDEVTQAIIAELEKGTQLWVEEHLDTLTASLDKSIRPLDFSDDRSWIDSTSAKTYAGVSEEGLFQFGLSCDHRPDLPQVKISLSALDPLYVPEIKRVRQALGAGGKTYIGDCKMGALQTRAFVADPAVFVNREPGGGLDPVVEPGLEAVDLGGICRHFLKPTLNLSEP